MNKELLIGWSEKDITPDSLGKKIPLYGQYYARIAKSIHSRLKCVAAAFSSGSEHFVNCTIDNCGCPKQLLDLVRAEACKKAEGLDGKMIFINAIHSHSAPSLSFNAARHGVGAIAWGDMDKNSDVLSADEYADFAVPIIVDCIVEAWNNRAPGGIATAFGNARIGHCRRAVYADGTAEMYGDTTRMDFIGLEAGEDTGVEMLFTLDKAGNRTGMFLNVACPSQNMESTYMVSSDFAGAAREMLKTVYGENFHTLYQISPAGCQSPRDLVRHYTTEPDFWHADGVEVLAKRLYNTVTTAELSEVNYTPELISKNVEVSLPRRRASYIDYKNAQAELERLTAIMPEKEAFAAFEAETHANEVIDGPGPYDSKLHHFVLIKNAQAVITRYENQDETPNYIFDMNVIRLGNIAIANNPFELYLYYGQNIKARSRAFQTFLVQLSGNGNFHAGYLPSPDAEKFGGYGGLIINGQVGSDGGYKLADRTVEEINKLFDR